MLLLTHHMLSRSSRDLGIDFAADVHDESHEVQPEHQDDHCAETSVSGVVTWSVLDIEREKIRGEYECDYGKQDTGHDPDPSLLTFGAQI